MFCGNAPCTCNAKPKKKPAIKVKAEPKVKQPEPLVENTQSSAPGPMATNASPMQGATFSTGISAQRPPVDAPTVQPVTHPALAYAAQVLLMSGIVHRLDVPKLEKLYRAPKTPALAAKVSQWRRRNRG